MRRIIVSIAVLFLSISLLAQKQVIIRFISEDPTAINTAVDALKTPISSLPWKGPCNRTILRK